MRQLYTERNLLRPTIERTWVVSQEVYVLLLGICQKYLVHLALRFPSRCPDDEDDICGVDERALFRFLKLRIPDLLRDEYSNSDEPIIPSSDEYDQYSLFDYIEYIAQNMVTATKGSYHPFFHHSHYSFKKDDSSFREFMQEINDAFTMSGLQYVLTEGRLIERITDADDFVLQAAEDVQFVSEKGLRELVLEAIALYHNARLETHHLATEKIWDAFERIKTVFPDLDKRRSSEKLIGEIAGGCSQVVDLLNCEFKALTEIGNKFRIRHHETDKIDIENDCFCDYLFVRCLALVDLAVRTVVAYE